MYVSKCATKLKLDLCQSCGIEVIPLRNKCSGTYGEKGHKKAPAKDWFKGNSKLLHTVLGQDLHAR